MSKRARFISRITDTPQAASRPSFRARTIIRPQTTGCSNRQSRILLRGVEKTVAKVSQAHNLPTERDDPQVELLLLRACLGTEKTTYLNRVIPTHTILPHATAFDESMRACLARITLENISDAAWSQAELPLAMGGLGLTHNARICSAAFISSSNMTTELVENLVIQDVHTTTWDPTLPQAIEHYDTLMTSEVGDLTMQTQSTLTLALHSRARGTLLAGA
jgi:hypothetical protein